MKDGKKYSGDNRLAAPSSSPYPVTRLSAPISLVDVAQQIEAASEVIAMRTNAQLQVIAEQIQTLRERAEQLMQQAQDDLALHQAECGFRKIVGQEYHLYQVDDGRHVISRLSPSDYGGRPPHAFVASYRLETDQSWTCVTPKGQSETLQKSRS